MVKRKPNAAASRKPKPDPKRPRRRSKGPVLLVTIPFPPSLNKAWRRKGRQYFLAKPVADFRESVGIRTHVAGAGVFRALASAPLAVLIKLSAAAGKPYDVDNCVKNTVDALKSVVFRDDSRKFLRTVVVDDSDPLPAGREPFAELVIFERADLPEVLGLYLKVT
jgi:Holliday junction resolvase RusA-like endonuclease